MACGVASSCPVGLAEPRLPQVSQYLQALMPLRNVSIKSLTGGYKFAFRRLLICMRGMTNPYRLTDPVATDRFPGSHLSALNVRNVARSGILDPGG